MTFRAFAAFALAALAGCTPTIPLPSAVPASGKLSLSSGEPVKNVRVFFQTIDARAPASGSVGEDGKFNLQTYDANKGACPGKYRVILQVDMSDPAKVAQSQQAIAALPEKYTNEASPLEVTIPSGGKTDIDLKLDPK